MAKLAYFLIAHIALYVRIVLADSGGGLLLHRSAGPNTGVSWAKWKKK